MIKGKVKTAPNGIKVTFSKKIGRTKLKIIISKKVKKVPTNTKINGKRDFSEARRVFFTNKNKPANTKLTLSNPNIIKPGPLDTIGAWPTVYSVIPPKKYGVTVNKEVKATNGISKYL